MNIKWFKILLLLPLLSSFNSFAVESIECKFTKYMRYANGKAIDHSYHDVNQYVKIINGKTTDYTLNLGNRAVNSDEWIIDDSYNIFYTGNHREMIAVIKDTRLGDFFDAQLINFGVQRDSITEVKGTCRILD